MRINFGTFVTFGFITLSSASAFERDVDISCPVDESQSATIESISLHSKTDEIKLHFRTGETEVVKPIAAKQLGIFGDLNFSPDLVWNNGQVYSPNTRAGDVYVRFQCFYSPDIFFERCISQGTGNPAPFAGVTANIGGKVLKFFGRNICSRTDHGPV